MKGMNLYIQYIQQTPRRINSNMSTIKLILIKLSENKCIEKFESSKRHSSHTRELNKINSRFLIRSLKGQIAFKQGTYTSIS
jgi:hypothetical protein